MDGVLADFDGYVNKIIKPTTDRWEAIIQHQRIYRDLEKTKEADDLVEFCNWFCSDTGYHLKILTAIPKNNDIKWVFYDKMIWMNTHFPKIPVMFGPYSKDKHLHCNPGDILIDDMKSNIEEWKLVDGIGIYHTGNLEKTINKLKRISG